MKYLSLKKNNLLSVCLTPNIIILASLFLPCFVYAQDSSDNSVSDTIASLSLTPANVFINSETCEDLVETEEFTLSGTYNNPSPVVSYTVRLIATTGSSCNHEDVCNNQPLDESGCSCLKELSNSSTVSTSFTVSELFDTPCAEGQEKTINFFLHYTETEADPLIGLNPIEEESQAVKLSIDLNPPAAPDEAPVLTPAEEALVINVAEVGGDVVSYETCVWAEGESREDARCREIMAGTGDRFEGLQNDVLYNVVYVVYDDANNGSPDSPSAQAAPASVLDFAEVYSGEYPGGERGGCSAIRNRNSSTFVFIFFLLLTIGVWSLKRRRLKAKNKGQIFFALFFLFLTVADANAKLNSSQSPKSSTVVLSGGAYQPSIDEEFSIEDGVKRPYERIFEDQSPLMLQVQLERHLLQTNGTLSAGGSFGFWSVEGEGLSVTTVSESTKLSVIPLSLYVGYRLDQFQSVFPVVPVFKAGLSYYSWTIYDGAGDVSQFVDGSEASGGTMGWFYSVGAHFLLDFLDKEMAWAFDRDAGVNHSYLTFEYQNSRIDDFADPDSFRLGNNIYFFGIALDI